MEKVAGSICLILFLCFSAQSKAQHLQIKAIEIYTSSQTANDELGGYSTFISKTRNPALFLSEATKDPAQDASITANGFTINFIFNEPKKPYNEYMVVIQSSSITTDLFENNTVQRDSIIGISSLQNSSQFFVLSGGYQRVFRHDKRLQLIVGSGVQLGIPVSANTTQTFNSDFSGDENQFFAKQSVSAGLSFPIGIRLKAFRNVSLALIGRPTLFYHRVDGNPSTTFLRGTNLSFQFDIRKK